MVTVHLLVIEHLGLSCILLHCDWQLGKWWTLAMQEQQSGQGLTLGLTSTPVKIILKDCNAWILGDKMVVFIALRWLVCKPWELATQASKQHLDDA